MAATIDKVMIINWALTEIGAGPMFSVDDTSDLALQIDNTWQRTVDTAFSLEDWNWAKRTVRLVRQVAVPENGWRYGFDLPPDRVGPAVRYLDQPYPRPRTYRSPHREGATVYANCDALWATIRIIVAVDDWDAGFRAAFVKLLASELAVPVWQDAKLKEQLRADAVGQPHEKMTGGMFGRLMAQNKAETPIEPEPMMENDPLTAAHHGDAGLDWAGKYGGW